MPETLHTIQSEALLPRFRPLFAVFYDFDSLLPSTGSITQDKKEPTQKQSVQWELPVTTGSNMITLILSSFIKWIQKQDTGTKTPKVYLPFLFEFEVWTMEKWLPIELADNHPRLSEIWDEVLHIQDKNTHVTEYTRVKRLPSVYNHMNLHLGFWSSFWILFRVIT